MHKHGGSFWGFTHQPTRIGNNFTTSASRDNKNTNANNVESATNLSSKSQEISIRQQLFGTGIIKWWLLFFVYCMSMPSKWTYAYRKLSFLLCPPQKDNKPPPLRNRFKNFTQEDSFINFFFSFKQIRTDKSKEDGCGGLCVFLVYFLTSSFSSSLLVKNPNQNKLQNFFDHSFVFRQFPLGTPYHTPIKNNTNLQRIRYLSSPSISFFFLSWITNQIGSFSFCKETFIVLCFEW